MKRIVTMQDISCVGKCSASVAMPIISAMGCECAILPTAVLSTHTAFENFNIVDLTDNIPTVCEMWKREGIAFDMVYTGYLASVRQIDLAIDLWQEFGGDGKYLFVDPVMGDFGRLYTGFEESYPAHMKRLCRRADIIVPNLTEAFCLLGEKYRESVSVEEALEMAKRLTQNGPKAAVITGISPTEEELGIVKFERETEESFCYFAPRVETPFPLHGSGDVFAAVTVGGLCSGKNINDALAAAVDFVAEAVRETVKNNDHRWYGIDFETVLNK
ncbi:MAG: pyridoxamine kinase [Clostridia bacterium]|nr:pyridoxamine kinase [Clostridia bacterium]